MSEKPHNKIRRNVKKYVDMDYVDLLPDEDKEFLRKFTDEYYCGGHGKPNSLHRETFGDAYDTGTDDNLSIKQEMNLDMNAQNRDVTGIAGCSNNVIPLEEVLDGLITDDVETIKKDLTSHSPEELLAKMIKEYSDEINTQPNTSTEEILREYAHKAISLFLQVKKEAERQRRINKKKT